MGRRSKLHRKFVEKYGVDVVYLATDLTKEQAESLEKFTIEMMLEHGFKLANNNIDPNYDDCQLVNHTKGGDGGCYRHGIDNPQYHVSPKDRMDSETYNEWLAKCKKRLCNQIGKNNPNYGNDTLKKKLEKNPELKKEYYSRPGKQNGRARPIALYDINNVHVQSFDYIGECAHYIKDCLGLASAINGIRSHISQSIKTGKPYRGFYFKFL